MLEEDEGAAGGGGLTPLTHFVCEHVMTTVGAVTSVFSDEDQGPVPIDVVVTEASEDMDFHLLVTAGMSIEGQEAPSDEGPVDLYTELVMLLPKEWLLTLEDMENERHYWPFRWMREIGTFPHEEGSYVCPGHTIQLIEEPMRDALGMDFVGVLLYIPSTFDEAFQSAENPAGEVVHFMSCIPLYAEELDYSEQHGVEALVDKLVESGISEVVDLSRPKAV